MHVVSVGEGNIDCDETHSCDHETNGVLLLPESKNRWQAFKVHTMMLPQHAAAVTQQVAQSKVVATVMTFAKSGVGGTALMLMVFLCLGFVLLNMFGGSSEQRDTYENKPDSRREEETSGSWAQAYGSAQGARRSAMDLLFRTGIIATQDLNLPYVNATYIEECVQIAAQMLRERSLEDWVLSWEVAQQTFADRLSNFYKGQAQDVMAAYEFSDGSWARAYRQSEGQRDRREAFELLLRLGIISPDEFANSLVTPKYIEERLSVAMNLLNQKPLSQWVDLCETTGQGNFRESVLACFSTQGGGASTPPRQQEKWGSDEWVDVGQEVHSHRHDPHRASTPPEVRRLPVVEEFAKREKMDMSDSAEGPSAPGTNTFSTGSVHFASHQSPQITEPTTITPGRKSPRMASGASKSAMFVLPTGANDSSKGVSPRAAQSMPAGFAPANPARVQTPGSVGTLHWPTSDKGPPTSGFGSGRNTSPRAGDSASQGVPVQIMFSNNAISGSAWESRVTPPGSLRGLTPPGSHRDRNM